MPGQEVAALRDFDLDYVSFGSKAEVALFHRDVRTYAESGRWYQATKIQHTASNTTKITFPKSVNADSANNTHINPIIYFVIHHFSSNSLAWQVCTASTTSANFRFGSKAEISACPRGLLFNGRIGWLTSAEMLNHHYGGGSSPKQK
jgi:hypothetical protein